MPPIVSWRRELTLISAIPSSMRTHLERAAVDAAERIRALASELRRPDCDCCTEAVLQMERIAWLLEEIVG